MEPKVYIHYGHKAFDLEMFKAPTNRPYFCKPDGGLWASPLEAKFGWKDWCEKGNFADCRKDNCFRFRLTLAAKVYHIRRKKDVELLPMQDASIKMTYLLPDFEKIVDMGYDAIEFHLSDQSISDNPDDDLYWVLYGWDCDSILVLNSKVIIPMK